MSKTGTVESTARKPSPRVEARRRRDEALMALGLAVYRGWVEADRPQPVPCLAEIKAADNACADVALQA